MNWQAQEITVKYNRTVPLEELQEITSPIDSEDYLRSIWEDINLYESFYILVLSQSNKVIGWRRISTGGIAGTVVDVRIILNLCLQCQGTACIIAHNHPSGNLNPSRTDRALTSKIKNALKLIDVQLLDHLILTENDFYSFVNEDKL